MNTKPEIDEIAILKNALAAANKKIAKLERTNKEDVEHFKDDIAFLEEQTKHLKKLLTAISDLAKTRNDHP